MRLGHRVVDGSQIQLKPKQTSLQQKDCSTPAGGPLTKKVFTVCCNYI